MVFPTLRPKGAVEILARGRRCRTGGLSRSPFLGKDAVRRVSAVDVDTMRVVAVFGVTDPTPRPYP